MDRSLIGGRPHQTLKPYTTLAVGYPMEESLPTNVHRWGLGDGALDMIVFQGRKGQAKGALLAGHREPSKKLNRRKLEDLKRKLTFSQKLGGNVPKFRPPQPSPLVPPNYFSSPITQGLPLGDAQGWLRSNAPEFRPTQLSPQELYTFKTT
ncbi:hypothetical protein U9M48_024336 [Paspalum notatum var. saurae]|uniref:Uncharacterized protein n=1 Tax=Paspalum notatum var. saurae TaxID=547442 RepID=A0AAQ3WWW4_PASNO